VTYTVCESLYELDVLRQLQEMMLSLCVLLFSVANGLVAPSNLRGQMSMSATLIKKMPSSVKPGVVTGQALVDLLQYAKDTGFAIPAVNAVSSCGINACMEAAMKFKGPMIVQ